MKRAAAGLALSIACAAGSASAFPVNVLQSAGPSERRYNVAILGDGYRASDQTKLTNDAKQLIDAVFADAPYARYRQLFNFKVVQSVSVDQGAEGGQAGGKPNTLFKAYYNCSGVSQLVCFDEGAVLSAAAADVPEFDLALLIVNDEKYGGSGGGVPCVSTNSDAAEILRHELGHNIANLADEYESPYPGYGACSAQTDCREPNATLRNVRADIKWLDWLEPSTPVPTPKTNAYSGTGVFEGGRYLSSGIYRPVRERCKMRSLNQPFCPVCSEALVRSFWNLPNVHLIDTVLPAGKATGTTCTTTELSVTTPAIASPALSFVWTVDGKPQVGTTGAKLALSGQGLGEGAHEVTVTVSDATELVRRDPTGLLNEEHTWQLELAPCADPMPGSGGSGGSAGSAGNGGTIAGSGGAPAGGGSGETSSSSAGSAGSLGGTASAGSAGSMQSRPPPEAVACGCRVAGARAPSASALGLLLAAAALFRRRRV